MLTRFAKSGPPLNSRTQGSTESLEATIHQLIPIARAMGIKVVRFDMDVLTLAAPLANNINHQMSAFGGSLFSVAALTGWGLLRLKLAALDLQSNTVIADGDVSYKRPVFDDFTCVCELPESYPAFTRTLMEKGKSSLILTPTVMVNGEVAMTFSGRYVVSLVRDRE